jgi:hypothetical protein
MQHSSATLALDAEKAAAPEADILALPEKFNWGRSGRRHECPYTVATGRFEAFILPLFVQTTPLAHVHLR